MELVGIGGFEPISVVTLTRNRPQLLGRAIASVRGQDYPAVCEHVVIIDDDDDSANRLRSWDSHPLRPLVWHVQRRTSRERGPDAESRSSVYPRIARLLNIGIRRATSPWVAFLDDDNEFEAEHLSTLMDCARASGSPAVHSSRAIFWPDGSPYLDPIFPGAPTRAEGARIHALMCDRAVWVRGTNVLHDRVDRDEQTFRNSTVIQASDPVFLVDQNLWLVRRDVLLELPVPEDFSEDEIAANTCPDDKMLEVLVQNDVPIASTRLPTVRYYVGGISNGKYQLQSAEGGRGSRVSDSDRSSR